MVDARTQQLQAPSTALVTKHAEDPKQDIVAERRRASFNTSELLYWLNGGREKVERRWAAAGNLIESVQLVGSYPCSEQHCCAAACQLHSSSSVDQPVTPHQLPHKVYIIASNLVIVMSCSGSNCLQCFCNTAGG